MEAIQKIDIATGKTGNIELIAKITLVIIMLSVIGNLVAIYQTRYQLESPLLPKSIIYEINKQFIFHALVSAIVSVIAFILYIFEKYVWVIVLVVLTLIVSRYIYV